jgi:truncated hemoglobin YjbI
MSDVHLFLLGQTELVDAHDDLLAGVDPNKERHTHTHTPHHTHKTVSTARRRRRRKFRRSSVRGLSLGGHLLDAELRESLLHRRRHAAHGLDLQEREKAKETRDNDVIHRS